jgi:hypothetical protein
MRLRNAAVAIVVLAVTRVLAQGTPPAGTSLTRQRNAPMAGRGMASLDSSKATAAQTPAVLHQRVEEMQDTLAKMHVVLKQMRAKATKGAKGGANDSLTTANLDMWELMLGHLDKQFEELRSTTLAREDLEARRAALYKQADARAALAAKTAQAAGADSAAPIAHQGAAPSAAENTPAAPATPPTQPAPAASSQN